VRSAIAIPPFSRLAAVRSDAPRIRPSGRRSQSGTDDDASGSFRINLRPFGSSSAGVGTPEAPGLTPQAVSAGCHPETRNQLSDTERDHGRDERALAHRHPRPSAGARAGRLCPRPADQLATSTQRKQQEEGPLSWAADRNLPTIPPPAVARGSGTPRADSTAVGHWQSGTRRSGVRSSSTLRNVDQIEHRRAPSRLARSPSCPSEVKEPSPSPNRSSTSGAEGWLS
jgi:hypothetical protein